MTFEEINAKYPKDRDEMPLDEIKEYAAEGKFLHYDSIRQAFEL